MHFLNHLELCTYWGFSESFEYFKSYIWFFVICVVYDKNTEYWQNVFLSKDRQGYYCKTMLWCILRAKLMMCVRVWICNPQQNHVAFTTAAIMISLMTKCLNMILGKVTIKKHQCAYDGCGGVSFALHTSMSL